MRAPHLECDHDHVQIQTGEWTKIEELDPRDGPRQGGQASILLLCTSRAQKDYAVFSSKGCFLILPPL